MGREKHLALTAEEERLVRMLKALGNPVRWAIIKQLAGCGRCICGTLVAALPLAQSTVSQHLKVLKEAGLTRGEIEGPATCYCLDYEGIAWFKEQIGKHLGIERKPQAHIMNDERPTDDGLDEPERG
ncbi:MAG TPA: winged helix-turn-helix transcriptional regulator [Caldilineae bacterium]|nr:winged helix-turn-helix transcriptional regulator [Caldilineae bacterium]